MNGPHNLASRLRGLGTGARVGLRVAGVVLAWLALAPVGYSLHQVEGVLAVSSAAGVCLAASVLGLFLAALWQQAVFGVLAGSLVRMALPLAFCLLVIQIDAPLVAAGFPYYVLVFYLWTLAIDTALALPDLAVPPKPPGAA